MGRGRREGFQHHFEGTEVLAALVAAAGCPLTVEAISERFRQAQADGEPAGEAIPALFDGEPRFADPFAAQLTFQNLLGLWDLLASGRPLPRQKVERPAKPKPRQAVDPGEFEAEGPDPEWMDAAWQYLEDLGDKGRTRLLHSFENRQDAVLTHLDEIGLSDDGYLVARQLLFELHAMLELGWRPGVERLHEKELAKPSGSPGGEGARAPEAFTSYVDEALFEAEHDDQAPLPADEAKRVRETVGRCLQALWRARRPAQET